TAIGASASPQIARPRTMSATTARWRAPGRLSPSTSAPTRSSRSVPSTACPHRSGCPQNSPRSRARSRSFLRLGRTRST
ncbi:MAG: hypothetical protein ACK56I_26425, partial [bacterium]